MSKFLITDPCYIVTREEWDRLGDIDGFGDGFIEALNGYKGKGFKIIEAESTANGDGSISGENEHGEYFQIGVDAGLVCLVECDPGFNTESVFGAFTQSLSDAQRIYSLAKQI